MKKTILTLSFAMFSIAMVANGKIDKKELEVVRVPKSLNLLKPSAFCNAIMKGDIEAIKKMISLGEDVNQKSMGMTPAHYAARYNKAEILKVLIANGADLKKRCERGYTIKKYAELSNAIEALEVLKNATRK